MSINKIYMAIQRFTLQQKMDQQRYSDYQIRYEEYNKNVAIYSIIASLIIIAISLTIFKKVSLIADGLLLGGILTEFYGIFRGFSAGDLKFEFITVTVGLTVALSLGYLKFIKKTS